MYRNKNNEVIFDNVGNPSIMVKIPKFNLSEVIDGAPNVPHPAFIVDGVEVSEIYISKYQNIIIDGNACSLPMQKPSTGMNFDEAVKACENKGEGWHLMTNAEWAAIALWCKKNDTLPRGNNDMGNDYSHQEEKGVKYDDYRVLTGSGPDTWAHDHTPYGIFDLNGNVWEFVSGLRLVDGEIQIIPDNNAATHIDQSKDSVEWKTIEVDGESVKFSESEGSLKVTTDQADGWDGCLFKDLETDIEIPVEMKALGLFPTEDFKTKDYLFADAEGERLAMRGGAWRYTSSAGVFMLYLSNPRTSTSSSIGFRSAYVIR